MKTETSALIAVLMLASVGAVSAQDAETAPIAGDAPVLAATEPPADAPAAASASKQLAVIAVDAPVEPVPATAEPARANRMIEEVVVTSQRREERLLDVPISITAFSTEQLDAAGIETAQDLPKITPGLTVTLNGAYNIVFLRGVGTDAFLPGADSSVPFYLDGVALNSSGQGTADAVGRVERIEVLKGPQGTLFGRNATGGAINIITPDPSTDMWSGEIKGELAEYDERNIRVYASGPIFDGLAVSLSGFHNERDNYQINLAGPVIDIYSEGVRSKIKWVAAENLDFTLAGSYQTVSDNAGLAVELKPGPLTQFAFPSDEPLDRTFSSDQINGAYYRSSLISAQVDWRFKPVELRFIGSDQRADGEGYHDFDQTELPLLLANSRNQPSEQRTAEFQILSTPDSPFGDRLEWVAGLFYLEGFGGFDPLRFKVAPDAFNAAGLPPATALALNTLLDAAFVAAGLPPFSQGLTAHTSGIIEYQSYSAFAQGTYTLIPDRLHLTLGARYQSEERGLSKSNLAVVLDDGTEIVVRDDKKPIDYAPDLTAKQLSPRVALRWNPGGGDSQIFSSYSRGYKSPTYNTVNVTDRPDPVKEEKVDAYELGFKTRLLDSTLRLNGAVFYTEQEDVLTGFVSITSGGIVSYQNAGETEIKGAELDFLWVPMPELNPGLVLTGSGTLLDAEYVSYPNGPGFDEATGLAYGPGSTTPLPPRDLSGNRVVRTPKRSYNLGFNQRFDFGDSAIEIGADLAHSSSFFFLPQNSDEYARAANTVVDARISYFYTPWQIQLTAFGRNITDEEYVESNFSVEWGSARTLNAPRVFGAGIKWTF